MLYLAEAQAGAGLGFLIPMIVILVLFFWFTHRSQKKKEQERQELLDSIKVGDDVVTIGGINGRVTKVKEDAIELRVNSEKDVKVLFAKSAISQVTNDKSEEGHIQE